VGITGTTYIPEELTEVLDNYLLWRETFWIKDLVREREIRKQDFVNARIKLRNRLHGLTANQYKDLFWGLFTNTIKR
jgi:hypothetical protein